MNITTLATQPISLPQGNLRILGASHTVTGAMSLLELDSTLLLIDCGQPQGAEGDEPFPEEACRADAVVLTHGHLDHVGWLPELWRRGVSSPIIATGATHSLTRIVLEDSLRLQGATDDERSQFVRWLQQRARTLSYDTWHPLAGSDVRIALREAGHILGSASVEVRSKSARVIVSGDVGRPDMPILRDPYTAWEPSPAVDLVVLESTYGDREHPKTEDTEQTLERIIKHAQRDGGHILVPAFAIGRTQTLLYHLNSLLEAGRLTDLPVALDTPMGLRVTQLYEAARHLYDEEALGRLARGDAPLDFDGLYAVRRGYDSRRLRDMEPMLIIAGSGMCTGGRIVGHLQELLPRKETCVLFVGYQGVGTPGRRILAAAEARERDGEMRSVWLGGQQVQIAAEIVQMQGLSAHADRSELRAWLKHVPNPRHVLLHHGEPQAQQGLAAYLGAAVSLPAVTASE